MDRAVEIVAKAFELFAELLVQFAQQVAGGKPLQPVRQPGSRPLQALFRLALRTLLYADALCLGSFTSTNRFCFKFTVLDRGFAKNFHGSGHITDLILAARSVDDDRQIAARQFTHCLGQGTDRVGNAENNDGDDTDGQPECEQSADGQKNDGSRRRCQIRRGERRHLRKRGRGDIGNGGLSWGSRFAPVLYGHVKRLTGLRLLDCGNSLVGIRTAEIGCLCCPVKLFQLGRSRIAADDLCNDIPRKCDLGVLNGDFREFV